MSRTFLHFLVHLLSWRFFAGYAALTLVYFCILLGTLSPPVGDAFFMTFSLATGGDPYQIRDPIEKCWVTWVGAWLLHFISWVFIPALIGLAVTQAAGAIEAARWRDVDSSLEELAALAGLNPEETNEFRLKGRAIFKEELERDAPPTR